MTANPTLIAFYNKLDLLRTIRQSIYAGLQAAGFNPVWLDHQQLTIGIDTRKTLYQIWITGHCLWVWIQRRSRYRSSSDCTMTEVNLDLADPDMFEKLLEILREH